MPAEEIDQGQAQRAGIARLFVSYSRKDRDFVKRFTPALTDVGYAVWVDLKDIPPSEDWLAAIHAAIDGADAFVFVVSPDSVDPRSVCKAEVDYAVERRKRLIPVVCRGVDTRATPVPEAIGRVNWIPFLDPASFDSGIALLKAAIETDLDWVREHTRLTVRAAEWQRSNRDESFVLQKNDLLAAEAWLKRAQDKQPPPTAQQTEFILDSRAAAERRRRRVIISAVTAAMLIAVGLTIAWFQAREATERRAESQARALAAEAQFERTRRLDRAIAVAMQALQTRETPETVDAALAVGRTAQDIVRILRGHRGAIKALCFVSNGRQLVSAGEDGQVILWNLESGSPVRRLAAAANEPKIAIACNPAVAQVAISVDARTLEFWEVMTDGAKVTARLEEDVSSPGAFYLLAFSADGKWLASSSYGVVTIRSAVDGRQAAAGPSMTKDGIISISMSHDGSWIALGTPGSELQGNEIPGRVALWRRGSQTPTFVVDAFDLAVRSVGVAADGGAVIAVGVEGLVSGWSANGAAKDLGILSTFKPFESRAAAFDPSGVPFVIADGRTATVVGSVENPDNFQTVQVLAAHARVLTAVAVDLAGRRAASGSEDGLIIVHALRTAQVLDGGRAVSNDNEIVHDASFSADGRFVIVTTSESNQYSSHVRSVPFAEPLPLPASATRSAPGPYSVEHDGERAVLKRAGQPEPLGEIVPEPGQNVLSSATTSDGRHWGAATENTARLRSADRTQSNAVALPANFGLISEMAFSPNGKLAAVAGGDATNAMGVRVGLTEKAIVLVDTATGRALGPPFRRVKQGEVSRLEFSPDGTRLLSVGDEVSVWLVDPWQWLRRSCAVLDVGIDAAEWEKRLPGIARPAGC